MKQLLSSTMMHKLLVTVCVCKRRYRATLCQPLPFFLNRLTAQMMQITCHL